MSGDGPLGDDVEVLGGGLAILTLITLDRTSDTVSCAGIASTASSTTAP